MKKVTVYNRDGSIFLETECDKVESYLGIGKFQIIVKDRIYCSGFLKDEPTIGNSIVTNLSTVVSDKGPPFELVRKQYEIFHTVVLLSDSGSKIATYNNVENLMYEENIVHFYVDETWYSIMGNLVIKLEDSDVFS